MPGSAQDVAIVFFRGDKMFRNLGTSLEDSPELSFHYFLTGFFLSERYGRAKSFPEVGIAMLPYGISHATSKVEQIGRFGAYLNIWEANSSSKLIIRVVYSHKIISTRL